jgi:hypothetical protein
VGVKLLVLNAVITIGYKFFLDWNFTETLKNSGEYRSCLVAICFALLLFVLAQKLPHTIAGIIQGAQINAGNPIATAGVQAAKKLGGAVAGAGGAVVGAAKLAGQQGKARRENPGAFANDPAPRGGILGQIGQNLLAANKGVKASDSRSMAGQLASKSLGLEQMAKMGRSGGSPSLSGGPSQGAGTAGQSPAQGPGKGGEAGRPRPDIKLSK